MAELARSPALLYSVRNGPHCRCNDYRPTAVRPKLILTRRGAAKPDIQDSCLCLWRSKADKIERGQDLDWLLFPHRTCANPNRTLDSFRPQTTSSQTYCRHSFFTSWIDSEACLEWSYTVASCWDCSNLTHFPLVPRQSRVNGKHVQP